MRVRDDLPIPTLSLAEEKIKEFDKQNEAIERGLSDLISRFPLNTDVAHVLVKVAAINSLYNTQIRGVLKVAECIWNADIDHLLESGSADAVLAVARVDFGEKTRWNYSFATKYCSWHRSDSYHIYDSRVDFCLRSYRRMSGFDSFTQENLWNYDRFRGIVKTFQRRYGLEQLSFKEVDKFLYQLGNEFFG